MTYVYHYTEIENSRYGVEELIARMMDEVEKISYHSTYTGSVANAKAYAEIAKQAKELEFYASNMSEGFEYIAQAMSGAFEPPELGVPAPEEETQPEVEKLDESELSNIDKAMTDLNWLRPEMLKPEVREQYDAWLAK